MVAKTPPKLKKMVAPPLNPILVRETLKKVEMCMGRLQELQFTVTGGNKVISGVSLSPRSTRSYLKTSLRCKQESLRIKNGGARKSPVGKFPASAAEWKRMSLPAMLVGETVGEILRASKFAREIVESVTNNGKNTTFMDDPRTPLAEQRNHRPKLEDTELRARRKKEKQEKRQSHSPLLQRARSRINFKVSPPSKRDVDKENARYLANRVSPKNKPWSKKAVLFPNPLFLSSDNSQHPKFCRTKSPIITKNRQTTPHKFLIKSPASASKFHVKMASRSPPRQASLSKHSPVSAPKFHVKIRSPPVMVSRSPPRQASLSKQSPVSASKFHVKIRSPPRQASLNKQSPKKSAAFKLRQSFSPARLTASKLRQSFSPARLRQSFSPSRLAARLVSPLKSRKGVQKQKYDGHIIIPSGLKHPTTTQLKI